MLWAALLPSLSPEPPAADAAWALAAWALHFTPRVAWRESGTAGAALVLEVAASARLFGGRQTLRRRLADEAAAWCERAPSWAPNAAAAVCLARAGVAEADDARLAAVLDALPLAVLTAAHAHEAMLLRLGCATLGALRRLPRGGVARRFDRGLLLALDEAYGLVETAHRWVEMPASFALRAALPMRLEEAPSIAAAARPMLRALAGWLAARHEGVLALELAWRHDAMRPRAVGDGDATVIRTAHATRDVDHLGRLLAERLQRTVLAAPVGELCLSALHTEPLAPPTASLLPLQRGADGGERLAQVSERVAARLGADRLLHARLHDDWRAEAMQRWHGADEGLPAAGSGSSTGARLPTAPSGDRSTPAGAWPIAATDGRSSFTDPRPVPPPAAAAPQRRRPAAAAGPPRLPQPTWLLDEPLPLALRGDSPLYQGELLLLVGPHRVDAGWWCAPGADAPLPSPSPSHRQSRDYWVALSATAGALWIFRDRSDRDDPRWFLHGVFA